MTTEIKEIQLKEFTEVSLEEKKKKLPKRLVYFSDGVLEEYSTDDEADCRNEETQPLIEPKTLPWVPYIWYLTMWFGNRTLAVCDYLGEHLAYFLGITSPKFQYEIDQYEKVMEEQAELKKQLADETAGWGEHGANAADLNPVLMEPLATQVTVCGTAMKNIAKESTVTIGVQQYERF